MKKLHFCTPEMLKYIKDPETLKFSTVRTGFVPSLYPGDLVLITERSSENRGKKDTPLFYAEVTDVVPVKFGELRMDDPLVREEVEKYGRKFHPGHYFFRIVLRRINENAGKEG